MLIEESIDDDDDMFNDMDLDALEHQALSVSIVKQILIFSDALSTLLLLTLHHVAD